MGWVYNLQSPDPDNQMGRVIALCVVFSTVSILAVALRFRVRLWVKKSLWVDDFAALFSALLGAAYAGLAVAQTRWGLGLHAEYFPTSNVVPFSKMQYIGGPIYTLALLGFKISLLASYLRIGGFVQAYRIIIIAAIVACACNQVAFTFVLSFGCHPIARQWDASIPGTCIDTIASYYGLAGTSLGFDVIIIALPLPVLAKLQLKLRQKILLGCLFGLGFFVTIIQIIRIFTIKNLRTYTDSQPIIIWSDIEISLGVIISCVPTYGPYFRTFSLNISSYRRRPTQSYGQHYNLSSPSHNNKIAPNQSGGRAYDDTTATVGMGDNDSEEIILPQRGQGKLLTGGMGIHIATEVRVERGPREQR